jgi:hypothetical protein
VYRTIAASFIREESVKAELTAQLDRDFLEFERKTLQQAEEMRYAGNATAAAPTPAPGSSADARLGLAPLLLLAAALCPLLLLLP